MPLSAAAFGWLDVVWWNLLRLMHAFLLPSPHFSDMPVPAGFFSLPVSCLSGFVLSPSICIAFLFRRTLYAPAQPSTCLNLTFLLYYRTWFAHKLDMPRLIFHLYGLLPILFSYLSGTFCLFCYSSYISYLQRIFLYISSSVLQLLVPAALIAWAELIYLLLCIRLMVATRALRTLFNWFSSAAAIHVHISVRCSFLLLVVYVTLP